MIDILKNYKFIIERHQKTLDLLISKMPNEEELILNCFIDAGYLIEIENLNEIINEFNKYSNI